jgi:hypothetical protein
MKLLDFDVCDSFNHEHRGSTVYKEVTNSDSYLLGSVLVWSCKMDNIISEVEAGGFSGMFLSE